MPERTIMKNISEMNQSEKQELLKKIEDNRQEQIKNLRDTLEELQINPKDFEDVECLNIISWLQGTTVIFVLVGYHLSEVKE